MSLSLVFLYKLENPKKKPLSYTWCKLQALVYEGTIKLQGTMESWQQAFTLWCLAVGANLVKC